MMASVSWQAGSEYEFAWWLYVLLLLPTFLSNASTFLLISYSPRVNTSSTALLVRYLAVEDAAFALLCLVQCVLNLSHGGIVGQYDACELQAAYLLFFALSTGYTLCCIAYNSEQKIGFKPGLSSRQVLHAHLLAWTAAAAISVIAVAVVAPARLVPSGTYCLAPLNRLPSMLLVAILGSALILGFLAHRYYLMWRHISQHTDGALSGWEQHRLTAQRRQVAVAKRMLLLNAVYVACYFPELVVNAYELGSGQQAAPAAHIVSGLLVHLNSFLNPVLYVYCNGGMRQALMDTLCRARRRIAPTSPMSPLSASPRPERQQQQAALSVLAQQTSVTVEETVSVAASGGLHSPLHSSSLGKQLPPVRLVKQPLLPALPSPASAGHAAEASSLSHPFQPAPG